ncbi:(2S)-3-sulfopropanediol dehydratase [Sporomusa sphaeroides]|uniref:Benzylsuccinate synthase alpha subunit n=1 Tax=Sporomusa sphaeroides DSM 2875 TaxID=1337886 RepID=A0ABP2CDF9_9FIRM|nr:glycyl radical protein [Sporomusa sphaeroides]OLS55162.1 benzylsuccinate synthase alpha subunit [Sporomusa sphaeroides DSM 2875]CVK20500.1 Benzylsuccinate synthase alpha subunit [Sporomusa sphaeroides DSM 2875]
MTDPILSPQEQRIQAEIAGEQVLHTRQKTNAILHTFKNTRPRIDIERAKYFTQSFRRTEGEPLLLRWAKALKHIAENITVYIDDHQLLVGRSGSQGRYGILYPELDGDFLGLAIEQIPNRVESPFNISEDDSRTIIEEIAPYWQGKTFHENLAKTLPAETLKYTYDPKDPLKSRFIVNETASFRSSIQWVHDYEKVLKRGFKAIKNEAEQKLAQLDPLSSVDTMERAPFLQAIIIICDAIVLWANRHARLAEALAEKAENLSRREELLKIAEICRRVPEHPARNFHEAMQAQWFTQMFSRMEQKTGTIISNGRMDQYLFLYYQQDLAAGIITEADALQLFECMWLAMAQFTDLYLSPTGGAFNEGYAHWEAVTIGGQTPDGLDATNELTYLTLRSKREFPLHYPDLAARIHGRVPARYLYEVAETIKEGSGFPKLINDEEVVPLLLAKGASFAEAYDYAVSGCSECRMPNRDTYTSPCAYINFPAAVEMTLYNGKMKLYGNEQIGLETGDPRTFAHWEEFWQAYMAQHINFLKHAFIQQHVIINLRAKHFAWPLGSALHDLCMKTYKDIHSPVIEGGIDLGYFEFMGYGTVVDSLAAIKKLVYEEKKLTILELLEAVEHNFEGYEATRQLLLHAPKYGNNDAYADTIAKELDRQCLEFTRKYSKELGVHLDLRLVPFTSHVPFGKVVSATPNGRKAYTPLSDGSSSSQGADTSGPTAVLLSNYASKNFGYRERAARLLNVKLSPACIAGEEGTDKLAAFIRTWCDLKLWHLQFNVINRETLLAAKKEPDKYRNLIVRIAGYSAYFTDLSPDLQDDLIARTEHTSL